MTTPLSRASNARTPHADDAISNLMRIRADTTRWRRGWTDLTAAATTWGPEREVAVLMLDIDKSGQVRAEGIEAKVELVGRCRERVLAVLPPAATVIDSGTRDETCVVLLDITAKHAHEIAEAIRTAVAQRPFTLDLLRDDVCITMSVGVGAGRVRALNDVCEAARTGLVTAKQTRDAAVVGSPRWISWSVEVPEGLISRCLTVGLDITHPSYEAFEDVVMQHTGIRYWLVSKGFQEQDSGLAPTTWRDRMWEASDGDADFLRLLEPVAETSHPAGPDLRRRHRSTYGAERSAVTVTASASIVGTLEAKVLSNGNISKDDVVTEALCLQVERRTPTAPAE